MTLDEKADYYAGYFYGEDFLTDKSSSNSDAPENAITSFSTWWAVGGEWFYIYQKSDTELALMNHWVESQLKPEEQEEYKEILIIPIESGKRVEVEDPIIVNNQYFWTQEECSIVYDGYVLVGMNFSQWLPVYDYDFTEIIKGNEGYRLYENSKYLDTVPGSSIAPWEDFGGWAERVELYYEDEPFNGLAINNVYPVRFGERTSLNTSTKFI